MERLVNLLPIFFSNIDIARDLTQVSPLNREYLQFGASITIFTLDLYDG